LLGRHPIVYGYQDGFSHLVKEYPGLWATYVEAPQEGFFKYVLGYEEHIKQWLLEVKEIFKENDDHLDLEVVRIELLLLDYQIEEL
jgi:hypothetical protein